MGSTGWAFYDMSLVLFVFGLLGFYLLQHCSESWCCYLWLHLVPPDGLSVLFQIEPGIFSILCYWFPDRYRHSISTLIFSFYLTEKAWQYSCCPCRVFCRLYRQNLFSTSVKLLTILDQNWFLEDFCLSTLYSSLSYPALDSAFR